MEDLIVTYKEHKVLKKFQKPLQTRYNVKIHMPKIYASAKSDVIFISINGEKRNRECVKKFLSEKMNAINKKDVQKENFLTITLSDSEEDQTCNLESDENSVVEDLSNPENSSTTCNPFEKSVYILDSPIPEMSSKLSKNVRKGESGINRKQKKGSFKMKSENLLESSVCIIESPIPESSSKLSRNIRNGETSNKGKEKKRNFKMNKKVRSKRALPTSEPFEEAELCEVSSTTEEVVPKKVKVSEEPTKEVITKELEEFIPLHSNGKSYFDENESSTDSHDNLSKEEQNDDIIVLDEPPSAPRPLRPVVIDGSNVAREHGKVTQTYSSKGIQLAVDYFLNRGHTQVTAFVPKFRRHRSNGNYPTTDPEILNDLEKKQRVVFTPSRRINGKCINAYDDRFVIQLASTNGGIIVSNDNFRDLATENDSFKDAIENRLLMYCFVGDIFMVPSDPLGRKGPTLSEFLSFPPDHKMS